MQTLSCQVTKQPFEFSTETEQAYARFSLPRPTVAPAERMRRLLAFRNAGRYFWRETQTGERVLSSFAPNLPFPISDDTSQQDARSFGRPFDRNTSFFQQLFELWSHVPRPPVHGVRVSQSVAVQDAVDVTESFLVTNSIEAHRCFYSDSLLRCERCVDCLFMSDSKDCYESTNCHSCSSLFFSENCVDCSDSYFLSDCEDCRDCLYCTNLRGKRYCIRNKQVSELEYLEALSSLRLHTRNGLDDARTIFAGICRQAPQPHILYDGTGAVSGNYLRACQNVIDSFQCRQCSDLMLCSDLSSAKDCLEGSGLGLGLEHCAQFVNCAIDCRDVQNSVNCYESCERLRYCMDCINCQDCIGCVGLRNAQFCILNMQYAEEQYHECARAIKEALCQTGQWGCFLTTAFSAYAYNNSAAMLYMPITKVQASVLRVAWDEESETVKPSDLLEAEKRAGGLVYHEPFRELQGYLARPEKELIFLCQMRGEPFQIIPEELAIYRSWKLIPPAECFDERQARRVRRLVPRITPGMRKLANGDELRTSFPENWRRPLVSYAYWRELLSAAIVD